jgi:hypothetical protein
MIYAEASFFDGYHFQHIVAWKEYNRLKRIKVKFVEFTRR